MPELSFLERAIADGYVEIVGEGKNERIRYIAANHSERWADPEEKIRAEFWAELIYKYEYDQHRMRFEVNVPRRTPNDYADIVIYRDEDLKEPYFIFECKRADISDAEFTQSIEQACGNRASLGAYYAGAIAGLTRRLLRFDKFPPGERDKNHMTDIPKRYGKPRNGASTRINQVRIFQQCRAKNYAPPSANATRPFGKGDVAAPWARLVNFAR